MASSIKEQKSLLRKRIKSTLGQVSEESVAEQSRLVTQKILASPEYRAAQSISIFLSMPKREISTTEIIRDALRQGKRVFIPYIHSPEAGSKLKGMDMLRLQDEQDLSSLEPDAWGIPSLSEDGINLRENALGGVGLSNANSPRDIKLDVVFMPGMAFDASNRRLGHGKGFYDRYLTRVRESLQHDSVASRFPQLIGLALHEQILPADESVPTTDDDWKIDKIITSSS